MIPDIEKYRSYVEGYDLSNQEKKELIHMVWRIAGGFVDRALGVDPVQVAYRAGGAKNALATPAMIELSAIASDVFGDRPEPEERERERKCEI